MRPHNIRESIAATRSEAPARAMSLPKDAGLLVAWREHLPLRRDTVDMYPHNRAAGASERGSAGVMAVMVLGFIAVVAWVALLKSDVVLTRLRVQTAADMAALTAAERGCAIAGDIAQQNGARLDSCQAEAGMLSARVRVCADARVNPLRGVTVCAQAHAGTRIEPAQ